MAEEARWYVAHTYSGYENKVKESIEKTVENRGLENMIMDIRVPVEDVVEKRGDKEKIVQRKIFPGYVVIKMIMNEESWYVVRNTRGVTGFVGPGSKPVPLTDTEVERMGVDTVRREAIKFSIGDLVEIKSGPMEGFSGNINKLDNDTGTLWVNVSMFGRETSVEINHTQVALMD